MLTLQGKNAENFKKMFKYIPDKVFSSILFVIEENDGKVVLKFSDIDINMTLAVNIEIELEGIDPNDIEDEEFRLPFSKNVKKLLKDFDTIIIDNKTIKATSEKKEIQLSTIVNDSDNSYDFPNNAEDTLEFVKEINGNRDALRADFTFDKDDIDGIIDCLGMLDQKENETIFTFNIKSKDKTLTISAKDDVDNNFKYVINNVISEDSFRAKYDSYFLNLIKTLKDVFKDREAKKEIEVKCIVSNILFCASTVEDGVKVCLTITSFEKK